MKTLSRSIFKFLIAAVILFLLYRSGLMQFKKIGETLFNPIIMLSGFFIFLIQNILFSIRWKLVTSLTKSISTTEAIQENFIGQFFNTFIPGGVGGDVIKALAYSKVAEVQKSEAISLTLIDRVFGIFGLVLFSFVFLLVEIFQLNSSSKKYFYLSAIVLAIGLVCLYKRKLIQKKFLDLTENVKNNFLSKIKDTFSFFFENLNQIFMQKKILPFLLISFVAQMFSIFFLYLVATQLSSSSPSFLLFFPLASFGFMAMAIPITPGAIGLGQMAFYLIFKTIDDSTAESVIIAISLMQFFYLILSLPGGYYFYRSSSKK